LAEGVQEEVVQMAGSPPTTPHPDIKALHLGERIRGLRLKAGCSLE